MTVAEQAIAQGRKEQLQKEINLNKVVPVDRSCYHKTEQDMAKLYRLKQEWKNKVNNGYIVNTVLLAGSETIPLEFSNKGKLVLGN